MVWKIINRRWLPVCAKMHYVILRKSDVTCSMLNHIPVWLDAVDILLSSKLGSVWVRLVIIWMLYFVLLPREMYALVVHFPIQIQWQFGKWSSSRKLFSTFLFVRFIFSTALIYLILSIGNNFKLGRAVSCLYQIAQGPNPVQEIAHNLSRFWPILHTTAGLTETCEFSEVFLSNRPIV